MKRVGIMMLALMLIFTVVGSLSAFAEEEPGFIVFENEAEDFSTEDYITFTEVCVIQNGKVYIPLRLAFTNNTKCLIGYDSNRLVATMIRTDDETKALFISVDSGTVFPAAWWARENERIVIKSQGRFLKDIDFLVSGGRLLVESNDILYLAQQLGIDDLSISLSSFKDLYNTVTGN